MRGKRAEQDFEAWLNDKYQEWQAVEKPPIDENDKPEQTAGLAKARLLEARLKGES